MKIQYHLTVSDGMGRALVASDPKPVEIPAANLSDAAKLLQRLTRLAADSQNPSIHRGKSTNAIHP